MFFLGFRNALFVGFAIPMSMFMSFMILGFLEKPSTPWYFWTHHGTGNVGRQRNCSGRECLPPYGKEACLPSKPKKLVKVPTPSSFQRLPPLQPLFRLAFAGTIGEFMIFFPLPYPLYWDHRSSLRFSSTPCWYLNLANSRPWNQSEKPVAHDYFWVIGYAAYLQPRHAKRTGYTHATHYPFVLGVQIFYQALGDSFPRCHLG